MLLARPRCRLAAFALLALGAAGAPAAPDRVPHPFLLWTKDEAAALRHRIERDPLAKKQYERMKAIETGHPKRSNRTLFNLFNYMVLSDEKAGEREKAELLKFIGCKPEGLMLVGKELKWVRGGPSMGDRHMRDEQTLNTLRYDVLYDQLTAEQRQGIEESFKAYIQFHLDGHKPWHPDFRYDRTSWLPNMHWPRAIGTHLMAVALKDEKLIDAMFHAVGGWKWYFDGYISDGRFYNEEFGKYYSNIGTMLMYCEALERLGLGRYGYGYTGKGGATMERFLTMFFDIGYPRTDIPGGMANYRRVTMGDAKGPVLGLVGLTEHSVVTGYLPNGEGGDAWWSSSHMNGPLPKAQAPLWYEWGHRRFPDAGFDYFLAQMRGPGEEVYLPSLYLGLKPIDPRQVKPPAVRSYVAMERGFAFLRAEESPAFWESPAPAVALQFGMYYVHYAHDCFSLLGYQAFNRPIYIHGWGGKGGVTNESIQQHRMGYIGGHPWHDTVRGYPGVVVDNLKAMPVDGGNGGLKQHRVRQDLGPRVKFVAGRAKGVYPDVDLERALFLTRDYLFDVFWLSSDRPRRYDWHVHSPGSQQFDARWKPTSELNGSMLYRDVGDPQPEGYEAKRDGNDLIDVRTMAPGDAGWSAVIIQDCLLDDLGKSLVGKAWYDRGVGVRVSLLGEKGTTAFAGRPPVAGESYPESGGATLLVRRTVPTTVFVALHEPFEGGLGKAPATVFERIEQNDRGVAVRIAAQGSGVDDRILFAYGDGVEEPLTLAGGGESFTFVGHAAIRVAKAQVDVCGSLRAMKLKVTGTPKLVVNGKEQAANVSDGIIHYTAP